MGADPELGISPKIRTTVNRQEIAVVVATDAGIPSAAPVDGTQGIDSLERSFQREGIVIKVFTVPALHLA